MEFSVFHTIRTFEYRWSFEIRSQLDYQLYGGTFKELNIILSTYPSRVVLKDHSSELTCNKINV